MGYMIHEEITKGIIKGGASSSYGKQRKAFVKANN